MMSKTQWAVLFCIFVLYLLIGATVFYTIESKQEKIKMTEETKNKNLIEELLEKYYVDKQESSNSDIFYEISRYCDKPLGNYEPERKMNLEWTFYHSIFYVMTIVSTIGYGNLSPTTPFTKTFMILYGLIGIPINGIVTITLGTFFGRMFSNVYKKWKNKRVNNIFATLGLVGKTFTYIAFGLTFFIFLPSIIIVLYERWSYDIGIEFTFGTLTTIGAGRFIPGTRQNGFSLFVFTIYRLFILSWILIGLGYLAMIFGFISRALQSKHIRSLEHTLAINIKKTNRKIRHELRLMLNEYLIMQVKPVYRKTAVVTKCQKTVSCPDLTMYDKPIVAKQLKKKAFSACTQPNPEGLIKNRSDSDSNLSKINREETFKDSTESDKLIFKVAIALGKYKAANDVEDDNSNEDTVEDLPNHFQLGNNTMRPRASSESKKEKPTAILNMPWYTSSKTRRMVEQKEKQKYGKTRSRTLPPLMKPQGIIRKLKTTFREEKKTKGVDVERQAAASLASFSNTDKLLEQTTLAEFITALTAINLEHSSQTNVRKKCSLPSERHIAFSKNASIRRISVIPVSPSAVNRNKSFSFYADSRTDP